MTRACTLGEWSAERALADVVAAHVPVQTELPDGYAHGGTLYVLASAHMAPQSLHLSTQGHITLKIYKDLVEFLTFSLHWRHE